MLKIRKFKETDLEFSELARIDNLVNHDSIDHPDDDKRDWNLRDKINRIYTEKMGVFYY